MLKKLFFLTLSVIAILPFAGQLSAATQEIKASDDSSVAWFWGRGGGWGGWGGGYYGGYYPYSGYGYGYGGYYPYSYGGCGYGGCY